ncbi:hypothetical protein DM02DRAFT_582259 [Periconia macrospinosa]|uniref:2-dehydropantoate 2-reductase n=1 Tax=Periconia macrospinosa TaxID=97972 RepID=A0A2V1E7M1_9PLEO|nr:hypothetical protein DM02DRAFT_582259 [Periconia macrospinosa]
MAKQGRRAPEQDESQIPERDPTEPGRNPAAFYRAQNVINRRIHVLGMGNVGKFMAHSLRGILPDPPPVTLIFHKREHLTEWETSLKRLHVTTDGDTEYRDGFDVELSYPSIRYMGKEIENLHRPPTWDGQSDDPIDSLIVCTKATHVLQALSPIKHRLHPESVILFLQNGMGTVEAVNREIFPDPATRPHYMLGINSHGLRASKDSFTTIHSGFGTIALGILPHERVREPAPYAPTPKYAPTKDNVPVRPKNPANPAPDTPEATSASFKWSSNHRYLLRTLLRTPVLGATAFSPPDLLQMQLEKLVVNCIVNPLTVILDARNGSILYNYSMSRVMRLLLSEISLVIRSLPELQHIPNVEQRFDPGRLETIVVGIANNTKENISSMLADVRAGRMTEIDYINGWIVQKGEELGIKCFMNYMLLHLVEGKGRMIQMEMGEGIPFVDGPRGGGELILNDMVAMEGDRPEISKEASDGNNDGKS